VSQTSLPALSSVTFLLDSKKSMEKEEYQDIKAISFPNTSNSDGQSTYGNTMDKWEFKQVLENGEMAQVSWIAVFKNDKKVAHIKQSVCNIFFK
jgi:hypothetical protein